MSWNSSTHLSAAGPPAERGRSGLLANRLVRELALVLVLKLIVLVGLRIAFFSEPVAVDPQRIDEVLLHDGQPSHLEVQ